MGAAKLVQVRRDFWVLIAAGWSVVIAAAEVGVSEHQAVRWLHQAGGMKPRLVKPASSRGPRPRLTLEEREEIAIGVAGGESIRSIAGRLGRAPSTIMRDIERNGPRLRGKKKLARYRRTYRFGAVRIGSDAKIGYRATRAQRRSETRLPRPKLSKLVLSARLHGEVQTRLKDGDSPEQISQRLRLDFRDDPEMRVSHEAIYRSLYVQGRGELRRELHKCLRTGRALRKPRRRDGERRGRIPGMVNISERPAEVEDRAVPGHWEGDLIVGKNSASAIGTLVERTTRFVMLLHLPHDHTAASVQEAMIAKMAELPEFLRRTLTWDQGSEMTNHIQISAATGLDIYFCDPHSPWQRGSNENTNGLLRQYFPKGTDLSVFGSDYLDFIADRLNRRPRKTLGWKTPAEALAELLSNPTNSPGVASTA